MQLTVMPLPLLVIDVTAALLRRIYQNVAFYYQIPLPQVLQIPDVLWKMFPAEISGFRVLYPTFSSSTINTWDSQVVYNRAIYLCLYSLLPVEVAIVMWGYVQTPQPTFREIVEMAITLVWGYRQRRSRIHRVRYFCLARSYNLLLTGNQDQFRVRLSSYIPNNLFLFKSHCCHHRTIFWRSKERRCFVCITGLGAIDCNTEQVGKLTDQ